MTLTELTSVLRMMGWIPIGGGILMPPENYAYSETIMLVGENEILFGMASTYYTNEEALKIILENTNE